MGLFEKLFPKKTAEAAVYTYFKTLGGYAPVYTSFEGGVYEMALTRACIAAGLVTKMSWAFTVQEDSYDRDTHTRRILKIRKVYDVSAVSFPANPSTDISARSWLDGVIEAEKAERLAAQAAERRKQRLRVYLEVIRT